MFQMAVNESLALMDTKLVVHVQKCYNNTSFRDLSMVYTV